MRDDLPGNDGSQNLPRPVAVQPDPMLEEHPVSAFRLFLTTLAGVAVVVLVMYGLSRPQEPEQQVAATQGAAQTNDNSQANNQAQPANAPANNAGSNAAKPGAPSTIGQGQSQDQGQQGQGKSPRSDSATQGNASAPSDKAAPAK